MCRFQMKFGKIFVSYSKLRDSTHGVNSVGRMSLGFKKDIKAVEIHVGDFVGQGPTTSMFFGTVQL